MSSRYMTSRAKRRLTAMEALILPDTFSTRITERGSKEDPRIRCAWTLVWSNPPQMGRQPVVIPVEGCILVEEVSPISAGCPGVHGEVETGNPTGSPESRAAAPPAGIVPGMAVAESGGGGTAGVRPDGQGGC